MPKGKPYSVYVQSAEGMKPGTKVTVSGEGVVQNGGNVLVQAFDSEGGPNAADKALSDLVGDGDQGDEVEGDE